MLSDKQLKDTKLSYDLYDLTAHSSTLTYLLKQSKDTELSYDLYIYSTL